MTCIWHYDTMQYIMRFSSVIVLSCLWLATPVAQAEPSTVPTTVPALESVPAPECTERLKKLDASHKQDHIEKVCAREKRLPECASNRGLPIAHFDFSDPNPQAKRILVFGMIHGDEPLSGQMVTRWAQRLTEIKHRNEWRFVPLLNPDGYANKTRTNNNGVDINRNFPTKDWNDTAVKYWRKTSASEKRRFPGEHPASEPETKCAMAQIQDFKPDFIVSVHTPYNVLDFDGPRIGFPSYKPIPWRSLGNFPGSLGRFMWKDHQIPVLTVELKDALVNPDDLQDMIGTFAIRTLNNLGKRSAVTFDSLNGGEAVTNRTPTETKKHVDL